MLPASGQSGNRVLHVRASLDLKSIRIDGDTQARLAIDEATVEHYAEELREGAQFPPGKAVFDGKDYWLWDGFHTLLAHGKAGLKQMTVLVEEGSVDRARWLAASANKEHDRSGQRRTNKDKRRAIEMALATEEGRAASDGAIAKHIGVTDKTVAAVRKRLAETGTPEFPESTQRVDWKGRKINTGNIGKRATKSTPEIPEWVIDVQGEGAALLSGTDKIAGRATGPLTEAEIAAVRNDWAQLPKKQWLELRKKLLGGVASGKCCDFWKSFDAWRLFDKEQPKHKRPRC